MTPVYNKKIVLINNMEITVKTDAKTGEFIISAPEEFIQYVKKLHGDSFGDLTLGEFIYKMIG